MALSAYARIVARRKKDPPFPHTLKTDHEN